MWHLLKRIFDWIIQENEVRILISVPQKTYAKSIDRIRTPKQLSYLTHLRFDIWRKTLKEYLEGYDNQHNLKCYNYFVYFVFILAGKRKKSHNFFGIT